MEPKKTTREQKEYEVLKWLVLYNHFDTFRSDWGFIANLFQNTTKWEDIPKWYIDILYIHLKGESEI